MVVVLDQEESYPIIICSDLGITKASVMIRIVEDIQMNVVNARVVQKDFIWYGICGLA